MLTRLPRYLTIVVMALLAPAAGCGGAEDTEANSEAKPTVELAPVAPAPPAEDATGPVHFADMAHSAGISFRVTAGTREKMWIPETMGQGVVVFDYDNDGDLDLYFANGGHLQPTNENKSYRNGLWRNDGNWTFTDVTEGSGVACPAWSCGTYAADYDGDGFTDLYVTQFGKNRLFRNLNGSGRFEDVTDATGAGCEGWSTSAAFFDADQDGDLDLYVCNYVVFDPENPPNNGTPCEWRKLKVCCGPRGLIEAFDVYYENKNGSFVDTTEASGFVPTDSRGRKHGAYSLGVVTSDVDQDGDIDVYVAVDSRPNLLFENLGKGKFREVGQEWQTARNVDGEDQAGMGVIAADLNDDLMPDLFVTNFSHDTNTLYLNAGSKDIMYFDDRSSQVGLGGQASFPYLSWGIAAQDFNCDGFLDLFVASGHVYPQAGGAANLGTSYDQPNQLYMADAILRYVDRAPEAGHALSRSQVSRSVACADFDRDGRIDMVVTNNDDYPQLLKNNCRIEGNWWGFHLDTGNARNKDGVGARLVVETRSGRKLLREVNGGGSYQCQGDHFAHLALPAGDTIKSLHCHWPDGTTEKITVEGADAWFLIKKGSGQASRQ